MRNNNPEGFAAAIAVSFDAKWMNSIKERKFTHVVRRRVPAHQPDIMYFYLNTPISGIVGRAKITGITRHNKEEAVRLYHELDMSVADINKYIGGRFSVGVYEISNIVTFQNAIKTELLQRHLVYYPPQNFSYLADDVVNFVEKTAWMTDI